MIRPFLSFFMTFAPVCSVLILVISLSACGFQPLYSSASGISPQNYSRVQIDRIEGRTGHLLRKALIGQLDPLIPPDEHARLEITLNQRINRLALEANESASQSDIITSAHYILHVGMRKFTGRVEARNVYIAPNSTFGDIAAQIEANQQAANLLSFHITQELLVKLNQAYHQTDSPPYEK